MHIQEKKLANDKIGYYIRYRDKKGKLQTLPRNMYPQFKTRLAAEKWLRSEKAKILAGKLDVRKYNEAKKNAEWRKKFHDFELLFILFEDYQKGRAPNSWENNMHYLEHYVFRYFLNSQRVNNVNIWYKHFSRYKRWLKNHAKRIDNEEPISYSTRNHCIRTLNNFLRFMVEEDILDRKNFFTCEAFNQKLVDENARTYEHVITEEDFLEIKSKMETDEKDSSIPGKLLKKYPVIIKGLKDAHLKVEGTPSEFFTVLFNTGMRFNELFSLDMAAIHAGDEDLPDYVIETYTQKMKKKIYGYIILESQAASKNCIKRDSNGHIERKPLKDRTKMDSRNGRMIPISDAETWNILVDRYKVAESLHIARFFTSTEEADYLLFNMSSSKIRKSFRKYCDKGLHACRHSFTTMLAGQSREIMMTRAITGHKSSAFEGYLHIYEEWMQKAGRKKPREVRSKEIKKVKVPA